ncbi:MAG: hypothetical protein QOK03_1005 [Candidatus Binataceae bacterium]|jgi:hypothetical protein|nr:hypothetical protein [Candidatus Binataceae bacterium]
MIFRSEMMLAVVLCAAVVLMTNRSARAQLDPFEFEVYQTQTYGAGMFEFESLNSFVPKGHTQGDNGTSSGDYASNLMYRTMIELSYGLTDKIEAGGYISFARPNGASFQYAGSKYRLRGSLFEQGELPIDLGWYVELEWHRIHQFDGNELEFEFKPLIEKNIGKFEIDLNPKFEKVIFIGPDKNRGFEFGYAAGVYYNVIRDFSPGVEFYGGIGLIDDNDPLHAQQHYIFPVIRGEARGIEYSIGPGFGLTRGSDRVITKVNLEFEHFVGALFN